MTAFAGEMELDAGAIVSGTTEIEWPRGGGRRMTIPEVDAARWLSLGDARRLILPSQAPLLDALESSLRTAPRR